MGEHINHWRVNFKDKKKGFTKPYHVGSEFDTEFKNILICSLGGPRWVQFMEKKLNCF